MVHITIRSEKPSWRKVSAQTSPAAPKGEEDQWQLMCIGRGEQRRQELLVRVESPGRTWDQAHDGLLPAVTLVDTALSKKSFYPEFSKPCYHGCFDLPVFSALCSWFFGGLSFLNSMKPYICVTASSFHTEWSPGLVTSAAPLSSESFPKSSPLNARAQELD